MSRGTLVVDRIFLDRAWIDPLVCLLVAAPAGGLLCDLTHVDDHGSFYQTISALVGTFLTLAVLAITIVLSRDLAQSVRSQLGAAVRGISSLLFGSLTWLVTAALLACLSYVVDGVGVNGWALTSYLIFVVMLALLPTLRIAVLLARLVQLNLGSKD